MKRTDGLKGVLISGAASKAGLALGSRLSKQHIPIFMVHRFEQKLLGISGHKEFFLRKCLRYLRDHSFNLISVDEIAEALRNDECLPPKSVAFTVDDGYWDQVEVAAHIFATYECPATIFVATGFVDGSCWLWDAKVRFLLDAASDGALASAFGSLCEFGTRDALASHVIYGLMQKPIEAIDIDISNLAETLGQEIPLAAPEKYAGTTWSRLRDAERMGIRIGAHTASHPLLSRESLDRSEREICESRDVLTKQVANPSGIFCYPVGRDVDFSDREKEIVKRSGFKGAVSAIPTTVARTADIYSMPRFGFPDSYADFLMYATWIESMKERIRKKIRRSRVVLC